MLWLRIIEEEGARSRGRVGSCSSVYTEGGHTQTGMAYAKTCTALYLVAVTLNLEVCLRCSLDGRCRCCNLTFIFKLKFQER